MSIFLIPAILIFSISAANAQTPLDAKANSKEILAAEFKAEYAKQKKLAAEEEWAASLIHARKAYELGKQLFEANDTKIAILAYNYGINLAHISQNKEARDLFFEALKIYEVSLGQESPELTDLLLDIARVNITLNTESPVQYLNRSLKISSLNYGADSLEYGVILVKIGAELLRMDRSQGQKFVMDGYQLLQKYTNGSHPDIALAAFNLGKYYLAKNKPADSVKFLEEVLAYTSRTGNSASKLEYLTHTLLVNSYEQLGKRDLATEHCTAIGKMSHVTPNQDALPLYRAAPAYPGIAFQRGKNGYVVVEFDIDEKGFVKNPKSKESNGKNFEKAAIKAIQEWRYCPAFEDGNPVIRKNMITVINFDIEYTY